MKKIMRLFLGVLIASAFTLLATQDESAAINYNKPNSGVDVSATQRTFADEVFGDNSPRAVVSYKKLNDYKTGRVVEFDGRKYKPGSIVILTAEKRLYHVINSKKAKVYLIGVGRYGFTWSGKSHISKKAEWPSWRPPAEMLQRDPDLPKFMKGGLKNPLGARALYLGSSLYRIHGTNAPWTLGRSSSSGCIRMANADVIDLYKRVRVGAQVYVYH
jgi:lipoprotein-anchoring transpeptidase ErfK/SrfK